MSGQHNEFTIGVGYQGHFGRHHMTDEQLETGIKLNKWLTDKYDLSENYIVGHRDLVY
ncbi:peptidoglycan recognition protein family protein [Salibacterium salarium]|uniref:peptidoglycan recognition protein family protein n=1 Tax=Salibacterium salarium TaxID=284579 RepID=UPI00163B5E52|nr:N-acetylmuramoyl-L-alanine amidase [Salibacterium salarium]